MFSLIKDRKHIEQNFHSVARVMPQMGIGGVKNFSVAGIGDTAPSTARSSFSFFSFVLITFLSTVICPFWLVFIL